MAEGTGTAAPPTGETPPPQTPPPSQPPPTTPPTPTPPTNPPAAATGNESAAERRIRELNEAKKQAEDRAKQAEDALKAKERGEMGDLDRARAEAEEAKRERDAATARATRLERSAWARSAAQGLGFIDPDDAVSMVDLDAADSETKVKNAVEKLKEAKPHLIGKQGEAPAGGVPPPGFGNLGGSGQPEPQVPVGADGQPDHKLGLGRELLGNLTGRRQG